MRYEDYKQGSTAISEYWLKTADDVWLRVLDFCPEGHEQHPPLIYVAGWISHIDGIKAALKVMNSKLRVCYVESREKQSSALPPVGVSFTMERMAGDLGDIVQQLVGEQPYYIAGSSLGATAILHHLGDAKARLPLAAGVIAPNAYFPLPKIALSTAGRLPNVFYPPVRALIKFALKFKIDMKNERAQYDKYVRTLDAADPGKLKLNARALYGYELWERLPNIRTPVLFIGAETDKLHGLAAIEQMAEKTEGSEMALLASNKETHSEKCGQVILDYLLRHTN